MNLTRLRTGASVVVLGALVPAIAMACPFCFSGSPRVRLAFFSTTIVLSLLPLGMIAAGVIWIWKSGLVSAPGEFQVSDNTPVPPTNEPRG